MIKFTGFIITILFNLSAFSKEIKQNEQPKRQAECYCNCANALSASEGIAIHATMLAELIAKIKFEKTDGDSVFPIKKDGRFEEDYDNDLLNAFSEFLKRDLRELNRAPTYQEMQSLIESRKFQMTAQRIVASQGFFNSIMGPGKFKQPEYVSLVRNDKVRPLVLNGKSDAPLKSMKIKLNHAEELPPKDDIAGWKELFMQANDGRRPESGVELKAFIDSMLENAKQTP